MWRYWISGLLVAGAVATMVMLGLWQLERSDEKAQLRERYAANQLLVPAALTALDTRAPANLFRRVTADCPSPLRIDIDAGRARGDGASGWRNIAVCSPTTGQAQLLVDIGVSEGPEGVGQWRGGPVSGVLVTEPQRHGVLARLFSDLPPLRPMIVASEAAPGLSPSLPPDPADLPDDHISYAIQWFIFALAATVIYLLALRQRLRAQAVAESAASV